MVTENISRSGLLVAWRGESSPMPLPSIGQILTVEVELPANHVLDKSAFIARASSLAFPITAGTVLRLP
jgi:hypothetical protein